MRRDARDLIGGAEPRCHNNTARLGDRLVFRTNPAQWSYSASLPVELRTSPDAQPVLVVALRVLDGAIGVGFVDESQARFLTSEIEVVTGTSSTYVELRPDIGSDRGHLMFRNVAPGGCSSTFELLGCALHAESSNDGLLTEGSLPRVQETIHSAVQLEAVVDVFVSHTSRRWQAEQCDRGYLQRRYERPDRLRDLPPFESLPPNAAPYHGMLSVFRVEMSTSGVHGRLVRHYLSKEKIVHAATVGDRVVVCFDAGLALFRSRAEDGVVDLDPRTGRRLSDPWFGGLHTVVPVDDRVCLVSSSGADAILWVDSTDGTVERRWRLPAGRYGRNYTLDDTTWLSAHYIPNDLQLGHLNCATPDGDGGAYYSVLAQGDVGHVSRHGISRVLVSGFVGCHGVRYDRTGGLYFCDSCSGRLLSIAGTGDSRVLFETGSRWLHDALWMGNDLFLLALGDHNRLVLADVGAGRMAAQWDFAQSGGTVQFLSASKGPT